MLTKCASRIEFIIKSNFLLDYYISGCTQLERTLFSRWHYYSTHIFWRVGKFVICHLQLDALDLCPAKYIQTALSTVGTWFFARLVPFTLKKSNRIVFFLQDIKSNLFFFLTKSNQLVDATLVCCLIFNLNMITVFAFSIVRYSFITVTANVVTKFTTAVYRLPLDDDYIYGILKGVDLAAFYN